MLHATEAPLELLRQVRGIDLVELPEARSCCGFGGTFAVKNADTSAAMLADKIRSILDTRRGGLHRARQLVPDAHRRRAVASARRRAHRPLRRDPRHRGRVHARATGEGFPGGCPPRTAQRAASPQPPPRHPHDPRQACPSGRRGRRLGAAARGRAPDQDAGDPPSRHSSGDARAQRRGGGRHGPLGGRRRRGQPDRHRARAGRRRLGGGQGQVDRRPTRSGSVRRSRRPASRRRRPTWPS